MKITIIVPCYNEAYRFDKEQALWLSRQSNLELLLIDDGSIDDTRDLIRTLDETCDSIKAIIIDSNIGKGPAIRVGVQWLESRNYQGIISYLDADFSTSSEEALSIINNNFFTESQKLFLFGSRIKIMGRSIDRKLSRHYLARIFATIVSCILNMPVYDSQCGFKAFTSDIAYALFEAPFTTKWFFDVELLFRSKAIDGINYIEHPLNKWTDYPGSKLKLTDYLLTIPRLLRIYLRYRKF